MEIDRRVYSLILVVVVAVLGIILLSTLGNQLAALVGDAADSKKYVRVDSAADLFAVMDEKLYEFTEEIDLEAPSHDEFVSYWNELNDDFAIHSMFHDRNVKFEYKEANGKCKIRLIMPLNACGLAMRHLYMGKGKDYETPEAAEVGEKLLLISKEIITDKMSDEEKVKAIHNYIITNYRYAVSGNILDYSECAVLFKEGQAQCQAYTEAFVSLCLLNGVEARAVSGHSTFGYGETAHAWAIVKLGNFWYHVDVTWDDPIPDVPGMIRYDFYLKGDFTMEYTHDWSDYFQECTVDYAG